MMPALRLRWQRLAARIDALSPRERVLCFGAAAIVLVFAGQIAVLGPLERKQTLLIAQAQEQRSALETADAETAKKLAEYAADPNQPLRERLAAARADTLRMEDDLRTMQKGLVPPERIAPLLESILRANGRLKLVSLRTLPVDTVDGNAKGAGTVGVQGPAAAPLAVAADPAKPAPAVGTVLYRHGVELTVRGGYLDMVDYMTALEALPTQLFWGRAQLDAEDTPNVRLTLTLYTLSLDPKWMKL